MTCGAGGRCQCSQGLFGRGCEGQLVGLGVADPQHDGSEALAVSADGRIVVGWSGLGGDRRAARWAWQTGTSGLLGSPDPRPIVVRVATSSFESPGLGAFTSGQVNGMSADGAIFVGRLRDASNTDWAIRWSSLTTPEVLGPGAALGVSSDASVVVGESNGHAVLWDHDAQSALSDVIESLGGDLAGFTLTAARAVSSDGRVIVGAGSRAGRSEAWVLRLPARRHPRIASGELSRSLVATSLSDLRTP